MAVAGDLCDLAHAYDWVGEAGRTHALLERDRQRGLVQLAVGHDVDVDPVAGLLHLVLDGGRVLTMTVRMISGSRVIAS